MEQLTDIFVIGTIIVWILYDLFALYMGYKDGVKTQYTISYRIGKRLKNIFVLILFIFALGVLVGHFGWHQCII